MNVEKIIDEYDLLQANDEEEDLKAAEDEKPFSESVEEEDLVDDGFFEDLMKKQNQTVSSN